MLILIAVRALAGSCARKKRQALPDLLNGLNLTETSVMNCVIIAEVANECLRSVQDDVDYEELNRAYLRSPSSLQFCIVKDANSVNLSFQLPRSLRTTSKVF